MLVIGVILFFRIWISKGIMAQFSRILAATVLLMFGKCYSFLTNPSRPDGDHQYRNMPAGVFPTSSISVQRTVI